MATAAANAYQRSEPRWIHATGCRISRLARIPSSLVSIRLPLPDSQSSQRLSTHRDHEQITAITALQ